MPAEGLGAGAAGVMRGPGRTAPGAEGTAGADGVGAGALGAAGAGARRAEAWAPLFAAYSDFSLRTTGGSTVELGDFTNSPMSCNLDMSVLLSTPNSLASSYTRTFATVLLVRSGPDRLGPWSVLGGAHRWRLIGCPSGDDPLSVLVDGWTVIWIHCWIDACIDCSFDPTCCCRCSRTAPASSGPSSRRARGNARRRSASSRHASAGCNQAPRPGSRAPGSGTRTRRASLRSATTRSNRDRSPR